MKKSLLLEITGENFCLRFGFTYAFEFFAKLTKNFEKTAIFVSFVNSLVVP